MPTLTVTFVQGTFVLATYFHIGNISVITDLDHTFWTQNFLNQIFFYLNFFDLNCFGIQIFLSPKFFGLKNILTQKFWVQTFWTVYFCRLKIYLWPKIILDSKLFSTKFFWRKILLGLKNFLIQNHLIPKILDSKYFLDQLFFNKDFFIR